MLGTVAVTACEEEANDCDVGSEGCDCTSGGTCDTGLVCLSDKCVVDSSGSGSGTGGSGGTAAGTGGESGGSGGSGGESGGSGGSGGESGGGGGTSGEGGSAAGTGGSEGGEGGSTAGTGGTAGTAGTAGTGGSGGDGGSGGSAPTYDYLECTDGWCCFTDCYGTEHCGANQFVACADDPGDLCGSSSETICEANDATFPSWFAENECILYHMEGGKSSGFGYIAIGVSCPCEHTSNGKVVAAEATFSSEGETYACDFSGEPEPTCDDEMHAECP